MEFFNISALPVFKNAAEDTRLFYPDSVISVPLRHIGIAQGRTRENIMAIRLERGPSISIAMTGWVVDTAPDFSYRDQSPRVLVAQITEYPQAAVEECRLYFGSRANKECKAYIVHDGSDPELLKGALSALKGTGFKVLMSSGAETNWGIDLETGKMSPLNPQAPIYKPALHQQVLIQYCIDGVRYMTGSLEILFDLSSSTPSSFKEDFELKNWSGRDVGKPLKLDH